MKISVIGTGYLGATHAACLAEMGHDVVGIDVDADKIGRLAVGDLPFHEPGLPELMRRGLDEGRLRFTTEEQEIRDAAVHFICVGTPQSADSEAADLSAVDAAVECVARVVQPDATVIGKSTVPVGTAARIRERLREATGQEIALAWNPEFLREGCAVEDSLRPERIVVGVDDDTTYEGVLDVYSRLVAAGTPLIRTDLPTAELAKVACNAMLAARLSAVNVLAEICDVAGGDTEDLIRILGSDSRIGAAYLRPGVGYGGSCLPKDVRGLVARAGELGLGASAALFHEADTVNLHRREQLVRSAVDALDDGDSRVTVLGAAFKKDSDDIRDSPAMAVALELDARGLDVRIHDPEANDVVRRTYPQLTVVDDAEAACAGSDLVMLLTDWDEFATLDPVALRAAMRRPRLVDARMALDTDKWAAAGWSLHGAGWGA
jgi:UDPglucose 6-dehydrogenase